MPGSMSERFANVAVNSGQPTRQAFTYAVPPSMTVQAGQAVFVPYGSRVLQGIVLEFTGSAGVPGVRPLASVADPEPVLDEAHIALARWLSDRYLAPIWECVAVSLPAGYGQKSVTMVSPVDVPPLLPVDPADRRILQYVAKHGQVTLDELREALKRVPLSRLERLQEQGHLTVAQGLARPAGRPRLERRLRLLRDPADAAAYARRLEEKNERSIAARILRLLATEPDVRLAHARELGANPAHIARLAADGWIEEYEARIQRGPDLQGIDETLPPLVLTPEQRDAADRIAAAPGDTFLLHGVTGSGKTEVYLDLIRRTLEAGRGAIVLLPEISLTPQALRRYGQRFGDTVTAIHSGLSTGELYDQWYRIKRGEARVVIGSRSAIFAPVNELGLVVIDEEHEWTYKQTDHQPRYHARAAAAELCRLTGATLVLGSATPDVTTYYRSETGDVRRIELPVRVVPLEGGATAPGVMPDVTVVDMREELRAGNRSMFSVPLHRAIQRALAAGEQAILFVNRRGSARFMLCRECGYVPTCPACEVAMSLDVGDPIRPRILCHHCGRTKRLDDRCPGCGGLRYRPFGVGTQRVEREAIAAFPRARVARWDSQTASRKGAHERIVADLEAGRIDILVGTQMLAKGLDLPAMNVVGVVDADVGLSLPDYVAHERSFQLLSQVAGRAGRRGTVGRVFIQTYEPDAVPIRAAADHDYRAFYEHELAHRRRAGYPPFSRLTRLTFRHPKEDQGLQEATRVATELRTIRNVAGRADPDVLGPTPAYIRRYRGEFRWHILLRGHDPAKLVEQVRLGSRWTVDVDPAGTL
ncbi:MAG: primosomal protein N' [Dehalococcoidia bacterium]